MHILADHATLYHGSHIDQRELELDKSSIAWGRLLQVVSGPQRVQQEACNNMLLHASYYTLCGLLRHNFCHAHSLFTEIFIIDNQLSVMHRNKFHALIMEEILSNVNVYVTGKKKLVNGDS